MIKKTEDLFLELKKIISREKKIADEMITFFNQFSKEGEEIAIKSQINYLKFYLNRENGKILAILDRIYLKKQLKTPKKEAEVHQTEPEEEKPPKRGFFERIKEAREMEDLGITDLEKKAVKRIETKKTSKSKKKKNSGPNVYAGIASRTFPEVSRSLISYKFFKPMVQNLLKTNLKFVPTVYISIILLTTAISVGVAILVFLIALLLNISPVSPFIAINGDLPQRFLYTFWILFVVPIGTFMAMYAYPSVERMSLESGINQELPFATINMSAIAGSKIEPTNIFSIIISTGEYPSLKSQFTKLINEINIYGHDLVTALKNVASGCPSKKLTDLYNGLATNITSGGDLAEFFSKRSETLLLDYRLEREQATKGAETFIDIYISIVIAAPMILMLLLVMIQISGLGISLSPTMISVLMVLGVSVVNFVFLIFLRLRQPSK